MAGEMSRGYHTIDVDKACAVAYQAFRRPEDIKQRYAQSDFLDHLRWGENQSLLRFKGGR